MSMRWRIWLAVVGAALMCISCAAIFYALWPPDSLHEQIVILSNMFRMP